MTKLYVREIYDEDGEPYDPPSWIIGSGHHPDDQEVFFQSQEIEAEARASQNNPGLISYSEDGDNQWTTITEIRVPTEHDKQQLLAAFAYLHDCYVDTDLIAVNYLVHMYQCPEKIVVNG